MAARRGFDGKLYRNTGTYGTPVWNEITKARDVARSLQKGDNECGDRSNDWEQFLPARKRAELTFQLTYDPAADDHDALVTSYDTDTVVDMVMADAAIATTGTRYFRCDMYTMGLDETQPLDGAIVTDVTMKPAYSSNSPTFTTVA